MSFIRELVNNAYDANATKVAISLAPSEIVIRDNGSGMNELFGLENSRKWGIARITGRVNADFLPITSNRDDFIRDAPEFLLFCDLMKKEVSKATRVLREEGDQRAHLQASSEVVKKVTSADWAS